jgi:hypothetical protein
MFDNFVLAGTIMSTIITIIRKFLCHHVATILTIIHLAAVLFQLTNPPPGFIECYDKEPN